MEGGWVVLAPGHHFDARYRPRVHGDRWREQEGEAGQQQYLVTRLLRTRTPS